MSDERDGGSFSGAVGRRCTDAFLAARCSNVDVTQGSQRQRAEEAVWRMHHCLLLFDPIIKVRFYSVTSVSPDVYGV